MSLKSGSLTCVNDRSATLFASRSGFRPSTTKMSPMFVAVEIVAAIFDPSRVALQAMTSRGPSVSASTLPVAIDTRFRLALPRSAATTMSDSLSADQTIGFVFSPRGAA